MKRSHQTIPTPSFLDLTQESRTNKAVLPLDTGVKHQYDKENDSHFVLDTESRSNIMPYSSPDAGSGAGMTKMECGRSLVEMLGVLAVIGVLSVGAIAGYRRAMDSQKASATIAELNQYALLASQQALQKRADLDLSELGNVTNQGYPVSAVVQADPTFFEIFLKDVPASICERILDSDWSVPLVMFANNYAYTGETGICDNGEDELADMAFQFKEDLNPDAMPMGGCVQDSDCKGSCVKCENQQCVSTCVGSERCATDQETGEKVCCPSEKRAGPMCCSSTQNGWCCNASGQCFPWHKPLIDKNGTAYACDYDGGVDVTGVESNCNVCSNRELLTPKYNTSSCVIKCPNGYPLRATTGKCYACDEENPVNQRDTSYPCTEVCPNRVPVGARNQYCSISCGQESFFDDNGLCHPCSEESVVRQWTMDGTECAKCTERSFYVTNDSEYRYCVLDCPDDQVRGSDGICYDCTHPEPIHVGYLSGGYCTSACPNRVANGFLNSYCSLTCADNQIQDKEGKCYDCSDTTPYIHTHQMTDSNCDACLNHTEYVKNQDTRYCILNCPTGQFRALDGKCYRCDDTENPSVQLPYYTDHYCEVVCPNRVSTGGYRQYCNLPCGDKQFTGSDGKCYDCDYEFNVNMGSLRFSYDCDKCSDKRNYYIQYTGNIVHMCVPKCPAETPLRGSDNKCYACDDPTRVPVTNMTDACYECPDERKLDGNYCVLK